MGEPGASVHPASRAAGSRLVSNGVRDSYGDSNGDSNGVWVLHPLLLAAYPVLFLWSRNASDVYPQEGWTGLAIAVSGVALLWAALHASNSALIVSFEIIAAVRLR